MLWVAILLLGVAALIRESNEDDEDSNDETDPF